MKKKIHYMPILKGKKGEFDALSHIPAQIKRHITPLIEVPPKKANEGGLHKIATTLRDKWGSDEKIIFDLNHIHPDKTLNNGTHVMKFFFDCLYSSSVRAIPTTDLTRGWNKNILTVISNISNAICLRLFWDDLVSVDELNNNIQKLLNEMHKEKSDVHLLIDLRAVYENENLNNKARVVIESINGLHGLYQYKSITVASSGFPDSLGFIKRGETKRIKRLGFYLWENIINNSKEPKMRPSFGDYGIVNPDNWIEHDVRYTPAAKIRHALEYEWIVLKGGSLKDHPRKYKQYYDMSHILSNMTDFRGAGFSWGSRYISERARGSGGTGNLTKWIEADTNHHITTTVKQLANYPSP
jgi:hypothetical protein